MKKLIFLLTYICISISMFPILKEVETKYFRIIYQDSLESYAEELFINADNIANKELNFYKLPIFKSKVTVLLQDNAIENAFYTTRLFNTIIIFPNVSRNLSDEKSYSSWIKYVFTHELTHLLTELKIDPYISFPFWLNEGIAVYLETKFSDGGRGDLPKFNMFYQYDVLTNKGIDFGSAGIASKRAYTYGYSFIDFYVSRYDEKKLLEVLSGARDGLSPWNWIFDAHIKTFALKAGKTVEALLKEWNEYVKFNIKQPEDLRMGIKLDKLEKFNVIEQLILKDNKLYFYGYSDKLIDMVYEYDIEKNLVNPKFNVRPANGFTLDNKNIYYSKSLPNELEGNLFVCEYKHYGYNQNGYLGIDNVINFLKLDDERLIVVKRVAGKESLEYSDGKVLVSTLEKFHFGKLFYASGKIYFDVIKDNEKVSYIYCYDLVADSLELIIEGFSPFVSDNILYFSNINANKYDIYSLNLKNGKLLQLTETKFAALYPVFYNDSIYYLEFLGNFKIVKLTKDRFLNREVSYKKVDEIVKINDVNKIDKCIEFKPDEYKKAWKPFLFYPFLFGYYDKDSNFALGGYSQLFFADDIKKNLLNFSAGVYGDKASFLFEYNHMRLFNLLVKYNPIDFYQTYGDNFNNFLSFDGLSISKELTANVAISRQYYLKNSSIEIDPCVNVLTGFSFKELKFKNLAIAYNVNVTKRCISASAANWLDLLNVSRLFGSLNLKLKYLDIFFIYNTKQAYRALDYVSGLVINDLFYNTAEEKQEELDTDQRRCIFYEAGSIKLKTTASLILSPNITFRHYFNKGTAGGEYFLNRVWLNARLYLTWNMDQKYLDILAKTNTGLMFYLLSSVPLMLEAGTYYMLLNKKFVPYVSLNISIPNIFGDR